MPLETIPALKPCKSLVPVPKKPPRRCEADCNSVARWHSVRKSKSCSPKLHSDLAPVHRMRRWSVRANGDCFVQGALAMH